MRYRIVNVSSEIIFCNLDDYEKNAIVQLNEKSILLRDGRLRARRIVTATGSSFAFSDKPEHIKSAQKFKTIHDAIHNSIGYIEKSTESLQQSNFRSTGRLVHNLTSLNAHIIQEIYSVIPQNLLTQKTSGHTKLVKGIVEGSSQETALAILAIAKAAASMKTEFSVFKKLFNPDPILQKKYHSVHKVLMNILYLFFQDFSDKNVHIDVSESTANAYFDYESIHVAMYHLLDNAAKYSKPNSVIEIKIEEITGYVLLKISMMSLRVYESEEIHIFDEGFSGRLATNTGKKGSGIGTFLVKEVLRINHGKIEFFSEKNSVENHMGIEYQTNNFIVSLPRDHKKLIDLK